MLALFPLLQGHASMSVPAPRGMHDALEWGLHILFTFSCDTGCRLAFHENEHTYTHMHMCMHMSCACVMCVSPPQQLLLYKVGSMGHSRSQILL